MRAPVLAAAGLAAAFAGALAVGLSTTGQQGLAGQARPQPTTSPSSTVVVPSTPCRIGDPAGELFLTTDQAKALTTAAATVVRKKTPRVTFAATVAVSLDLAPSVADRVAGTLLGSGSAERLSCRVYRDTAQPETEGPSGLTARAERLRRAWTTLFGPLPAGGFAPGGVSGGHVDSSSHYDGRAVDVFFRPVGNAAQARRGWVFAQWATAHADDYDVLSVIYSDRIWTSWASGSGWRPYVHPSGNRRNPVLRHLDHVHVAVESGRHYRGR